MYGLTRVKDACLQTESQIFIQARAQIGLSLWLIKIMKSPHLRFVITPLPDLDCTVCAELAIAWIA